MSLKWLINTPIAHRGLHHDDAICPENSVPSFLNAIHNGYPIEFDIQVTEHGEVIVFHDTNLIRMCGIDMAAKNINTGDTA